MSAGEMRETAEILGNRPLTNSATKLTGQTPTPVRQHSLDRLTRTLP